MRHTTIRSVLLGIGMCLTMTAIMTSGLVLGGCSDARTEKLQGVASGLAKTSASITELKVGVSKTNNMLQKFRSGAGFTENYVLLKEQISAMKESAAYLKANAEEMTTHRNEIVVTWREEINAVKDPVLKASAAERSKNLSDSVGDITSNFTLAKEAYLPYVACLDEITKFLDRDQTPSGVKVAGPAIEKSVKAGLDVQVQLQMLSSKLDALTGEVSPAGK
ncbi:MAG TPA: hypothetical protein VHX44_13395 [Planctomycetota bacterium]|nr:hypothetical protein [Planctomycetota bacterium]